jgi:heme exporter protein A
LSADLDDPSTPLTASSLQVVVELDAVARRFGRQWALRGVSLDVPAGSVLGVMGHNGSGKSTLLRIIATALRPTSGTVRVFGHDVQRDPDDVRAVTGFLGHSPGLYDDLTAGENLEFAATMLGLPRADVGPVLERVGLSVDANRRVRGFSAGMSRRLALGRLLLHRPKLLLLDEPYNNLDTEGIALVNAVIEETRARGGAAVVVVHDLTHAARVIDDVITMRSGKFVSTNSTRAADTIGVASDGANATARTLAAQER